MKSLVGKVKVSYCAVHNTYPEDGEPCWGCANPFIESAYQAGLKKAAQQSVQPTVLTAFENRHLFCPLCGGEFDVDLSASHSG